MTSLTLSKVRPQRRSRHERENVRRALAVVGMANETNRLANGYRVPIDPAFDK
jgi:hypothetical protein